MTLERLGSAYCIKTAETHFSTPLLKQRLLHLVFGDLNILLFSIEMLPLKHW